MEIQLITKPEWVHDRDIHIYGPVRIMFASGRWWISVDSLTKWRPIPYVIHITEAKAAAEKRWEECYGKPDA